MQEQQHRSEHINTCNTTTEECNEDQTTSNQGA